MPVLGYVAPGGARAASAGTYILYACHIAAMAPATHLGAATPVALGGSTPMPTPSIPGMSKPGKDKSKTTKASKPGAGGDAEAHKVLNDAIAYIRSLAQLRHRNADWAESAVRGAATLTASEAADKHVVDFVAPDVQALLAQADGRKVKVGEAMQTLHLKGLPVRDYAPDWRTRLSVDHHHPTIAYVLLLVGIYGLVLEAFHPGAMLPGIVGAISLLIGAYALQLLPVNYAGLALMALGIGMIIGEALMPTVGALGIGGVVAFVIGSIMLMNTGVPGYAVNLGVILGLATVAAGLLLVILWAVMSGRRRRPVIGDDEMAGLPGEILCGAGRRRGLGAGAWRALAGLCADGAAGGCARARRARAGPVTLGGIANVRSGPCWDSSASLSSSAVHPVRHAQDPARVRARRGADAGSLHRHEGPGLVILIPFIQRMIRVDLRINVMDVPPQDVISRDNVSVRVNAVIYFRVVEPDKAVLQVSQFYQATSQLRRRGCARCWASTSWTRSCRSASRSITPCRRTLDEATDPWGIKITNVELKDVDLNETMVRAIARQAEAERERRAKVIHAEGELQVAEKLRDAARMLSQQGQALQLRYLQTLADMSATARPRPSFSRCRWI